MVGLIPYGKQTIAKDDINAVTKALKNNFLTTGPGVQLFEKAFSNKTHSKFSVSSNSGTSAIILALKAINLKKDDIVILPAINFIAAANVSKIMGAKIIFSDVDKYSGQMTPNKLEQCIKRNKIKKMKVFFTMHNSGFNNYAKEFFKLKKKYKCFLIEDACHALGAKNSNLKNDYVGNCKYSDLTTFSFHPLKTITTCEGGMTTTHNKKFYEKMLEVRNHGFAIKKNKNKKIYNWQHKLNSNGYNLRLNDIQSHLGLNQIKKIDRFVKKRNSISKIYINKLKKYENYIVLPKHNKFLSAWHLFIILFKKNSLKITRDKIIQIFYKSGVFTQVHYIPNYRQEPFKIKNTSNFKDAEFYFSQCLSIPIFPELKRKQIDRIVSIIKNTIKKYKKFD